MVWALEFETKDFLVDAASMSSFSRSVIEEKNLYPTQQMKIDRKTIKVKVYIVRFTDIIFKTIAIYYTMTRSLPQKLRSC